MKIQYRARDLWSVSALTCALLACCSSPSPSCDPGREGAPTPLPSGTKLASSIAEPRPQEHLGSAGLPWSSGDSVWMGADFGMHYEPSPHRVDFKATERNPETRDYHTWTFNAVTTYTILEMCARTAGEFYVYGEMDGSGAVLERWVISPWPSGAYYTHHPSSAEPIGNPIPRGATVLRYKGPFIDPGQRTPPVLTRTPLAVPSLTGDIVEMVADPEARFLILRTVDSGGASTLVQFEISTGATSVIATPNSLAALTKTKQMVVLDSTVMGRLIELWSRTQYNTYLQDVDNDGVFESTFDLELRDERDYALPEVTLTYYP